jgi:hypothetical protein
MTAKRGKLSAHEREGDRRAIATELLRLVQAASAREQFRRVIRTGPTRRPQPRQ